LFEQVKVDSGGFGISWNDDIDLSCNELYTKSRQRGVGHKDGREQVLNPHTP
jgi:hypothetical protein